MPWLGAVCHIELYLGGVWVDKTADAVPPFDLDYGINGNTPNDRVAGIGKLMWDFNNSAYNSQGKVGLYSPGHVNALANFDLGTQIRVWFEYLPSITKYYKWYGKITSIVPEPGLDGTFRTHVQAVDWMDTATNALVPAMDVQFSQRSDQLITTLWGLMINPPPNTQIGFGMETFPTAFDSAQVESVAVLGEMQKICNSEMGFSYPKGDTSLYGLVAFEDRRKRGVSTASVQTFTSVNFLQPVRDREHVFDRVQVKIHPRRTDGAAVQVFSLDDKPFIARNTSYGPVICTYKDNSQNDVRIGAKNLVSPTNPSDFAFNTAADGSGTDISSQLDVSGITFKGSSAVVTIKNNGPMDGYLVSFRLRGLGIYDEGEVVFEEKDPVHQNSLDDRCLTFEASYQADTTISAQMAKYLLAQNNTIFTIPQEYGFYASDDTFMKALILREISDRITVQDQVTGISNDFFINHVAIHVDEEGIMSVRWLLVPADLSKYWILDSLVYSVLNSTTILAYGLWNQFWILGNATLGVLGTSSILSS